MEKPKIYPSILSGDFGRLADEAKRLEEAGADGIHIDIMDGHFVPNLTLGPRAVAAIHRATSLFLDVHLMIYNPFDYIERFIQEGADGITFHFEATEDVEETLLYIRNCGKQAGLSFCPETSLSMIPKYLTQCDLVLLMTVHPGFGGQTFLNAVLEKIEGVREYCARNQIRGVSGKGLQIQVDGGIEPKTARECVLAGANVLVSGSYVFRQANLSQAIQALRNCV